MYIFCVCVFSAAEVNKKVSKTHSCVSLNFPLRFCKNNSFNVVMLLGGRASRHIRSVHHLLLRDALVALIWALVVTKLDYCCSVMVCISGTLLHRLQSVLNAAARLVFSARRSDHITPLLRKLHWLKITERIQFRLCVLAYHCLHGSAPSYLAETLHLTSDIEACCRLRSGSTSTLSVLATRRSSLDDRPFPVAAARAWNTLPVSLRTAASLLTFCRSCLTFYFQTTEPCLTL